MPSLGNIFLKKKLFNVFIIICIVELHSIQDHPGKNNENAATGLGIEGDKVSNAESSTKIPSESPFFCSKTKTHIGDASNLKDWQYLNVKLSKKVYNVRER